MSVTENMEGQCRRTYITYLATSTATFRITVSFFHYRYGIYFYDNGGRKERTVSTSAPNLRTFMRRKAGIRNRKDEKQELKAKGTVNN